MKLDLMILANHAEVANDLLYIAGGGWDTINVHGRIQGTPDNVFAVMQGHLVIKLLFHATETDRDHVFRINVMGEDGEELAAAEGGFHATRDRALPPGWLQNVNLVMPVSGIPLPAPGNYVINLTVNGQWVGDRPFRVLKLYDD